MVHAHEHDHIYQCYRVLPHTSCYSGMPCDWSRWWQTITLILPTIRIGWNMYACAHPENKYTPWYILYCDYSCNILTNAIIIIIVYRLLVWVVDVDILTPWPPLHDWLRIKYSNMHAWKTCTEETIICILYAYGYMNPQYILYYIYIYIWEIVSHYCYYMHARNNGVYSIIL